MAFYLKAKERVQDGVQRIVHEQISKALHEIDDKELDRHQAVHQVRKRCKKIRGVLRLVRPAFRKTYRRENTWFRDISRELSRLRDAETAVATFETLIEKFNDQVDANAFNSIRETLNERRRKVAEAGTRLEESLARVRERMREARERLRGWTLSEEGFAAVRPGLLKTYERGRRAMDAAVDNPHVVNFHQWRKRTKYHRYHQHLLRELWKPVLRKAQKEVVLLSDHLGDDHDLAVFRQTLLDSPGEFGSERDIQALLGMIDRRSAELRTQAEALGKRIFAEQPKCLGRRFHCYWNAWKEEARDGSCLLNPQPAVVTAAQRRRATP